MSPTPSRSPADDATQRPRPRGRNGHWVVIGMLLLGGAFGLALSLSVRSVIRDMKETVERSQAEDPEADRREAGATGEADAESAAPVSGAKSPESSPEHEEVAPDDPGEAADGGSR